MLSPSLEASFTTHKHSFLLLDNLLDNIDDALVASDANFYITHWNKAAGRIYDIAAEEAIGVKRNVLLQYEYINCSFIEIVKELKKSGKWKGVLKFTKKDGTIIYLQSSATVLTNDDGDFCGYVAINRDITQQYLTEQSLQNFTSILHFLDESFLIVDTSMKVVFLSSKKNVLAFHNSDYKPGDHALKYIPGKERKEVFENYRKAFCGEVISHETESEDEIEARIYLHITYMPVKNNFGQVTHVAIIIKDLTHEKRMAFVEQKKREAEVQLSESRILFENFMENCPLPAWVTDEDGAMQYMNPTYLRDISVSKTDIGETIFQLFPKAHADEYFKNNKQVLQTGKAVTAIEHGKGTQESNVTYLITKFPLQYQEKKMVAGWAIDITEQIESQKHLEEMNAFKNKLFSVIGHDLRAPLTVINALGSLVGDDNDLWTKEDLIELFANIKTSAKKAMILLSELTIWGQSRMNRIDYQPKQTDLLTVIHSSVDYLQEMIQEKQITINFNVHPDSIAYADADMLKTVVRNLVSNAVKFSPAGSVVTLHTSLRDRDVYISVTDEGDGINAELKNQILRGTNNTSAYGTHGEKGLGIGLTLCKDFIEANKGIMMIHNNSAKGCTFAFSVPKFQDRLTIA